MLRSHAASPTRAHRPQFWRNGAKSLADLARLSRSPRRPLVSGLGWLPRSFLVSRSLECVTEKMWGSRLASHAPRVSALRNHAPRYEHRSRWPRSAPCAGPHALVRGRPGVHVEINARYVAERRHLPLVSIRKVAKTPLCTITSILTEALAKTDSKDRWTLTPRWHRYRSARNISNLPASPPTSRDGNRSPGLTRH